MKDLLFIFCSLMCLTASAQSQPTVVNDTVHKVIRPDSIIVTSNAAGSETSFYIYGREGEPGYRYNHTISSNDEMNASINEHATKWDFSLALPFKKTKNNTKYTFQMISGLRLGATIPLQRTNQFNAKVGLHAGFNIFELITQLPRKNHALIAGLGFEVDCFKQRKGLQWIKQNSHLSTLPFADESTHRRSRLFTYSLGLQLGYQYSTKKTEMRLMVIPEFYPKMLVKNRYNIGNQHITDRYRHIDRRPFGVSFRFDVASKEWGGLYVLYSPLKRSTSPVAPNFNSLSIGYTF